jgi:hypothetical protein
MRARSGVALLMPRRKSRARHQQKDKAEKRRRSCETTKTRVKTAHAREQVREECQRSSC